jgi:hypothetical protein
MTVAEMHQDIELQPRSTGRTRRARGQAKGRGKPDKEYGLARRDAAGGRKGWSVLVRRRGRAIRRYFADGYYGGKEEARTAALSYRDAVLMAFPPLTTLETAQALRINNRNGKVWGMGTPH